MKSYYSNKSLLVLFVCIAQIISSVFGFWWISLSIVLIKFPEYIQIIFFES